MIKIEKDDLIKYDRTALELEEFLLFSIAVAGKTAKNTAKSINKLTASFGDTDSYFANIRKMSRAALTRRLYLMGFGCYTQRVRSFKALANSWFDLSSATIEELETIPGIGNKTSRFFTVFSRQGARHAILDRHILSFMETKGIDVPKNTPSGKRYLTLEAEFLALVPKDIEVAEFDFQIWEGYAK